MVCLHAGFNLSFVVEHVLGFSLTTYCVKHTVHVHCTHLVVYRTHSKLRPPFLLIRFSYKYGGAYNWIRVISLIYTPVFYNVRQWLPKSHSYCHCCALWHVNKLSWQLSNPCLAMSVWISPPTIRWHPGHTNLCWVPMSVTPRWVSNRRSRRPQLSPWRSLVILWTWPEFPAPCAWTGCHFVPTGGHLGPPPIARRISDPCGVLVPWASGSLVLSQTKDRSCGLCPDLRLMSISSASVEEDGWSWK